MSCNSYTESFLEPFVNDAVLEILDKDAVIHPFTKKNGRGEKRRKSNQQSQKLMIDKLKEKKKNLIKGKLRCRRCVMHHPTHECKLKHMAVCSLFVECTLCI
jgi:hypothetical protein